MDELTFATYLAPTVRPAYEAAAEYVGRTLRWRTSLVDGRSFDQLRMGEVDVAFLCGAPYVRLGTSVELLAAPVLVGERYGGRPVCYSDVIVRADHPARTMGDLRGAAWSYNDCESHSGYVTLLHRVVELGFDRRFFGELRCAGFHAESIRMVRAGEVDAAAIDSQVLELVVRADPSLGSRLRVLDTIGPSTTQPVVAGAHVTADIRRALAEALRSMHEDESGAAALAGCLMERFVEIADEAYDDIRAKLSAVEGAGLLATR